MKKLSYLLILLVAFLLFGCGSNNNNNQNNDNDHVHTYTDVWSFDDVSHWHQATCGHDVSSDKANHNFSEEVIKEATESVEGIKLLTCSICGYTKRETIPTVLHTHTLSYVEAKEATCTTDGNVAYYHCSVCNKDFADEYGNEEILAVSISKLNHVIIYHAGKKPTCTETGYKAFETCSRCDYTTYEELPATGHIAGSIVIENNVNPTCTTSGSHDESIYCIQCNIKLSSEHKIDEAATGHDLVHHNGKEPTCTETGYKAYDTCSRCDYTTYEVLPALGHSAGNMVIENKIDQTCTTDGSHDEVTYCTRCNSELSRNSVIDSALGHDLVHHSEKVPTCTETGYKAYDTCRICDYTTYEVLPALGHSAGNTVIENKIDPTCTTNGSHDEVRYCTRCNEELSRNIIIDSALGHDLIHHAGKDATCNEIGYEAYDTCSRCDYTTYEEIDMLPHTWDDGVITVEPTIYEKGIKTYTCQVCNNTKTEEIDVIKSYLINLNYNDGISETFNGNSVRIDKLDSKYIPFDLTKNKYKFKGWSYNNTQVFDQKGNIINSIELIDNMTLEAMFAEEVTLTVFYTLYNPKTLQLIERFDDIPTDMGDLSETNDYAYNTYVDLHAYPNEGYSFVGWYTEGQVLSNEEDYKYMMWDEDFTIEARFKYTSYDLTAWSNNTDLGSVMIREGNSQVFYNEETLKKYYTESVTVVAYSKTDTRFLGWYNENNVLVSPNAVYTFNMINRDYKLEAKWNYFGITYDLDGGINEKNNPTNYNVDMNNISLLSPTKEGYTFVGWKYNGEIITEIITLNVCHMELKALWTPNTDTKYKVEHYLQNIDDDEYELFETDNLTGTTDTLTNGSVNVYEGFASPEIEQININSDGKTVIKLYYERNSYDFYLSIDNNKAGSIVDNSGSYKYDKAITITANTNLGYTFNGWYDEEKLVSPDLSYTFNMKAKTLTLTAKWTANNTKYKVEHYIQNIDDDEYELFETDNLTGTTDTLTNGSVNTYEGFSSPEITQVNIDGNGNTVIELYYERNTYTVSLSKNINEAGSLYGAGSYKYGKEITLSADTNDGYNLSGWYINDKLYKEDSSFKWTVDINNVFEVRYGVNSYYITLENEADDVVISGIKSGYEYDYNSQITLTATTSFGALINWHRSDGVEYYGKMYSFKMPATDITITVTINLYTRVDNKIYFGYYPQTKVTNNTLISELNNLAGTEPNSSNKYNWTDYNYYLSSNITSYMFYQDIDYDNDGAYDYRGVYFTQYRPYLYSSSSSESNSKQYDNGYTTNTVYWFSYDPIEWNILTEFNGKALIIANLILDSQDYYPGYDSSTFSHNGGTGCANNYVLSNIRAWLNDNFYNTVFSDLQKAIIKTTTVDNSVASTGQSSNDYVCNNTNDKIFSLSYKEVTTYYTSSTARLAKGTDYAKAQGLYVNGSNGDSYWWTRSPCSNSSTGAYVAINGFLNGNVCCNYFGVRPALWVNLGE